MRDLSLNDWTQTRISKELEVTERLLRSTLAMDSGREVHAEIVLMPDLGMPHNVTRICGGFYTGAFYHWDGEIPFVPVDATVNIDSTSLFALSEEIESQVVFDNRIRLAMRETERSGYCWNFRNGNHFITYGILYDMDGNRRPCLALHASAAEYKAQYNGLYPAPGNWFSESIKVVCDGINVNRYLRYISGSDAEVFYRRARRLESHNSARHGMVAEAVSNSSIEQVICLTHHYGMPSCASVAIGCQILRRGERFLFMTAPTRDMYLCEAVGSASNRLDDKYLFPHGLGKRFTRPVEYVTSTSGMMLEGRKYTSGMSIKDEKVLEIRFDMGSCNRPLQFEGMRDKCPCNTVGVFSPLYSYSAVSEF